MVQPFENLEMQFLSLESDDLTKGSSSATLDAQETRR